MKCAQSKAFQPHSSIFALINDSGEIALGGKTTVRTASARSLGHGDAITIWRRSQRVEPAIGWLRRRYREKDPEGYIKITDRAKDFDQIRGEWIAQ